MSGSVLAFSVPTEEQGVSADLWWCCVLTGGSRAELSPAEDGSVSPGGGSHGVIGTQSGQSPLRDVRCLLRVSRGLAWFFCTCRLETGFAICLRHGETSRSRITSPNILEGSFSFPRCSSREKPNHMQSDIAAPHPVKETSLHVHSCHRAPQQCAAGVCKKRWMLGSGGWWHSSLVQLCVGGLEGALSGFTLGPAGRMKSCPMQGPFLSICYKSVLFTGCIWE